MKHHDHDRFILEEMSKKDKAKHEQEKTEQTEDSSEVFGHTV